jgi:hypothetical protein
MLLEKIIERKRRGWHRRRHRRGVSLPSKPSVAVVAGNGSGRNVAASSSSSLSAIAVRLSRLGVHQCRCVCAVLYYTARRPARRRLRTAVMVATGGDADDDGDVRWPALALVVVVLLLFWSSRKPFSFGGSISRSSH